MNEVQGKQLQKLLFYLITKYLYSFYFGVHLVKWLNKYKFYQIDLYVYFLGFKTNLIVPTYKIYIILLNTQQSTKYWLMPFLFWLSVDLFILLVLATQCYNLGKIAFYN